MPAMPSSSWPCSAKSVAGVARAGEADDAADHGGDEDVEQGDQEAGDEEQGDEAADLGDEMGVEAPQAAAAVERRRGRVRHRGR
jgi:hypothetical protein